MTGIFILKNYPNAKPISNLNFNSFSNLFNPINTQSNIPTNNQIIFQPISNQISNQSNTQNDTQISNQIDNRLLNKHIYNVNVFINNNIYKDKDTYNNIYTIKYNIYNTILCGVKKKKVKKPG
jgi:hypothetical protein